jgi:hypothetical protein
MSRTTFSLALLTLAFGTSPAWADEASGAPQTVRVACDASHRCATIEPQAGNVRQPDHVESLHWLVMGPHSRAAKNDTPCADWYDRLSYGWLVQNLLQWTDQLLHRIDRLGVIQTPWARRAVGTSSERASAPRITARPVRMRGGYGVEAKVHF